VNPADALPLLLLARSERSRVACFCVRLGLGDWLEDFFADIHASDLSLSSGIANDAQLPAG
jgi:hypothetical protein